jgi:DNA-binding IclR family transcriptional regulator
VLIQKGWARKDDSTGHFHPTARMAQVFGRVLADLDRAEQHLSEIRRNFTPH